MGADALERNYPDLLWYQSNFQTSFSDFIADLYDITLSVLFLLAFKLVSPSSDQPCVSHSQNVRLLPKPSIFQVIKHSGLGWRDVEAWSVASCDWSSAHASAKTSDYHLQTEHKQYALCLYSCIWLVFPRISIHRFWDDSMLLVVFQPSLFICWDQFSMEYDPVRYAR